MRTRPYHEGEPFAAGATTDDIGHRRWPVHDELRIQPRHVRTHGIEHVFRRLTGRDHLDERPVPIVGVLTVGTIDDHRRRPVHVQRDIAHDADDPPLAAACPDPLPEHPVERHAGEGQPGKVRAHDRSTRRPRIVAVIEGAAGNDGNSQCAEDIATDHPLLHGKAASVDGCAGKRTRDDLRVPRVIAAGCRQTGDTASRRHARNRLESPRELLLKRCAPRRVVRGGGQVHLEGQDTVSAEAEDDLAVAVEARQQDDGATEQRQRERHLRRRERPPQPCEPSPSCRGPRLLTKRLDR